MNKYRITRQGEKLGDFYGENPREALSNMCGIIDSYIYYHDDLDYELLDDMGPECPRCSSGCDYCLMLSR